MQKIYDSHIVDEFEGWNGDAIYQLDNGTLWKLAVYQYFYAYSYRPKASIYSDKGGYFLEVEGMGKAVQVNQA